MPLVKLYPTLAGANFVTTTTTLLKVAHCLYVDTNGYLVLLVCLIRIVFDTILYHHYVSSLVQDQLVQPATVHIIQSKYSYSRNIHGPTRLKRAPGESAYMCA